MKQQLTDYVVKLGVVATKYDNTSAINPNKNPILHSLAKHIDIRHHFIRDHVEKGNACLNL